MNKQLKQPNEDEIDEIIEAQADDDSAWGKPQNVRKPKGPDIPLPSELASAGCIFRSLAPRGQVSRRGFSVSSMNESIWRKQL